MCLRDLSSFSVFWNDILKSDGKALHTQEIWVVKTCNVSVDWQTVKHLLPNVVSVRVIILLENVGVAV